MPETMAFSNPPDARMTWSYADAGGEPRLTIGGSLDAVTVVELRPALDSIVGARPKAVSVDLSKLELIDSSGVGAIVSLFKRMREYGGAVRIEGVTSQPLAIFRLLRLDRVFGF